MKPITEKQLKAIHKLARATKTKINNVEKMSCFEASKVIEGLINRMNRMKNQGRKSGYQSDALAGLAVKILAQRCKVEEIVRKPEVFQSKAADLYRVFDRARQKCLA